jgi:hypothetical protein
MKCHFVPQSYLKRFLNKNNKLETFDLFRVPDSKQPKNRPVVDKATKITAQIEDWYVLHGIDDLPSFDFIGNEKRIEEDFQKLFENDLTSSLNNLEKGCITVEDKEVIARFVAFQLHRVPVSRSYYREIQKNLEVDKLSKEEKLLRAANIVQSFLATSISGLTLYPYLMKSKWVLLENRSNTPFITSDNPVMISNHPSNMDYLSSALKHENIEGPELDARKTAYNVAISPLKILYINTSMPTNKDDVEILNGHWASDEKVTFFNDLVFRSSLSCIYSNQKKIIEEYHKRFLSKEILPDLFVDDPWGNE